MHLLVHSLRGLATADEGAAGGRFGDILDDIVDGNLAGSGETLFQWHLGAHRAAISGSQANRASSRREPSIPRISAPRRIRLDVCRQYRRFGDDLNLPG
jgi:hypothetical protein